MHIDEKLYNGKFYGFLTLLCEKYSVSGKYNDPLFRRKFQF